MTLNEMTPEVARTKLCPQFAVKAGTPVHCFADECADWLWLKKGSETPTEGHCGRVHKS